MNNYDLVKAQDFDVCHEVELTAQCGRFKAVQLVRCTGIDTGFAVLAACVDAWAEDAEKDEDGIRRVILESPSGEAMTLEDDDSPDWLRRHITEVRIVGLVRNRQ